MEISIQRQPTDDSVSPPGKAGAELLPSPDRNGVISKELKVVGAVKVERPPVRVWVNLKVATVGYTDAFENT